MAGIGSLLPVSSISGLQPSTGSAAGKSPDSFGKTLADALNNVAGLQQTAEQGAVDLAAGNTSDIHNVLIATEKASLAVGLTVQVRNKVVEAYQQIMQMQI